jgi:hypothetical protein
MRENGSLLPNAHVTAAVPAKHVPLKIESPCPPLEPRAGASRRQTGSPGREPGVMREKPDPAAGSPF